MPSWAGTVHWSYGPNFNKVKVRPDEPGFYRVNVGPDGPGFYRVKRWAGWAGLL